jgi:hypothetical protein
MVKQSHPFRAMGGECVAQYDEMATTKPPAFATPTAAAPTRFISLFSGFRPYDRAWLSRDVIAGVALAAA